MKTETEQIMNTRSLILRILIICVIEVFVMIGFHFFFEEFLETHPTTEALLDGAVSVVTLFPLVYVFFFRPLYTANEKYKGLAKQLEERNEFFNVVINSLNHPFYVIDANDYSIKIANTAARNLGIDRSDTCYALTHRRSEPCRPPEHTCPLIEVKKTKKPIVVEHIHFDRNGNPGNFEVHAFPVFDGRGNVVQMIEYSLDITERKKLEEELNAHRNHLQRLVEKRTAELKEINLQLIKAEKMKSIGIMANGIAHNFNTILGTIRGFVDLALMEVPSDSRTNTDLNKALKAIEDAKELIKGMLIFSRDKPKELKPIKIHSAVEEAIEMFKASMTVPIGITQNIDAECGHVLANENEIKQIVMNLCTNAYHALEGKSGVIEVGLQEVDADADMVKKTPNLHSGRYACITISDTGKGMNQATISRIFEPFFTTKEAGKGTGLGLSVLHGIVMNHHGEIMVDSQPGKGTTFKVYLPLINNNMDEKREG